MSPDIVWHHATVSRQQRERLNNHRSIMVLFTGLSGAGKSTLAHALEEELYQCACRTFVLDGDNIRHGLNADLGFSRAERTENLRRIGELARLFVEAGIITLAAFIAPEQQQRQAMRALFQPDDFLEVYCEAALEVCMGRDVKGSYAHARAGKIPEFTGVSATYEVPANPDLVVPTGEKPLAECVAAVMGLLRQKGVLQS